MKTQQTISLTKFKEQITNKQIYCPQGNISTSVCSNKNCNFNAFICDQEQCQCRASHKLCVKLETYNILEILISKSFSIKPLLDKINKLFQKSIDQLSDMRDNILLQFKQKYNLLNLEDSEMKLINAIRLAQVKQISCNLMWDIISKIYSEKQYLKKIDQIQKDIDQLWNVFNKKVKDFQTSIKKYIEKINLPFHNHFEESKLIKTMKDKQNIISYFDKKIIRSTTLLYLASQNGFQASIFHQKCDNSSDTLTILQTEHGNIIGGYTAIKWNQKPSISYISDPQQRSFLFSLTLNQKIPIFKSKECQIQNRLEHGPIFGGGWDLNISDKAHKNVDSYTNVGFTYNNGEYVSGDLQSQKRFAGSQKFKVTEWQVWKLELFE